MSADITQKKLKDTRRHGVISLTHRWNTRVEECANEQKINPFSKKYLVCNRPQWTKGTAEYAKPVGKTAERGKIAKQHVAKEMEVLCYIIESMGTKDPVSGKVSVKFGKLFERYNTISNKLVGTLIRARRHHFVDFPGEMLWQKKDDHVVIRLLSRH